MQLQNLADQLPHSNQWGSNYTPHITACLPLDSKRYIHLCNFLFLLQMENLEPISQSGVSTTSKILRMLLGLKQKSSTKIVKDFMDGLAWEVLSCNGIRNYKLDLLSHQHTSTLLNLSVKEVLYFNKLSKTVLQKIQYNYYRKAIKHHFCS